MPTLAHALLTASPTPDRWCLVLHGILGSKTNWRTLCQRALARCPGWGFVLADLRNHGDSQGFSPPHTLDRVAADLVDLLDTLGHPAPAVIGHSYGAKTALALAHRDPRVARVLVVDSNPGARPDYAGSEGTLSVLDTLEALPPRFARRDDFLAALTAAGHSRALATWLGTNLVHTPEGTLRFRVDLGAVRAMLDDYFHRDLWSVVEGAAPPRRVDFLVGGRSNVLDADDLARLRALRAARPDAVGLVVSPEASHWVHVDDPAGTLDAMAATLTA